jgi:transglutaminase-like putative cysteine protease
MLTSNQFWVGIQLVLFVPLLIATVMLFQLYTAWFATPRPPSAPPARIASAPAFRRTVAGATVATLALSLFVFIIVPRGVGENVLGNWNIRQARTQTGFTDHVKLGSATTISTSPTIVLDMMVRDASPSEDEPGVNIGSASQVYYLRGAVLDKFDPGTGVWQPSPHAAIPHNPRDSNDGLINLQNDQRLRESVREDINIYGLGGADAQLFALWHPVRLQAERNASTITELRDVSALRRSGPPGDFNYTVWSATAEPIPENAARTPDVYDSPRLRDLASSILRDSGVDPDPAARPPDEDAHAAKAIQDYLQRNFTYTLVEQATPARTDPIEHFLFSTKEGHCEYFAAAMTLLCRSVGVHARMVAGYVAAEFNSSTGRYVVRESNAHAWVEAESAGRWRTFDPTPPSDLVRIHKPAEGLLASLRRAMESVEYAWNSGVVGFDEGARQRLFGPREGRRLGLLAFADRLSRRLQNANLQLVLSALATGIAVFVAVAAAGMLVNWSAARVRAVLRRRASAGIPVLARLPAQRRAQLRFYARLLEIWRDRGTPKPSWKPPGAHARSLASSTHADRLSSLYYAATFGDRPLTEADVTQAQSDLAELERAGPGLSGLAPP